jgi:hypothetical protein
MVSERFADFGLFHKHFRLAKHLQISGSENMSPSQLKRLS